MEGVNRCGFRWFVRRPQDRRGRAWRERGRGGCVGRSQSPVALRRRIGAEHLALDRGCSPRKLAGLMGISAKPLVRASACNPCQGLQRLIGLPFWSVKLRQDWPYGHELLLGQVR